MRASRLQDSRCPSPTQQEERGERFENRRRQCQIYRMRFRSSRWTYRRRSSPSQGHEGRAWHLAYKSGGRDVGGSVRRNGDGGCLLPLYPTCQADRSQLCMPMSRCRLVLASRSRGREAGSHDYGKYQVKYASSSRGVRERGPTLARRTIVLRKAGAERTFRTGRSPVTPELMAFGILAVI